MQHLWLPADNMNRTHSQCWINSLLFFADTEAFFWPRHDKCHAIGLHDGIHIGFPVIPQLLSYDTSVFDRLSRRVQCVDVWWENAIFKQIMKDDCTNTVEGNVYSW